MTERRSMPRRVASWAVRGLAVAVTALLLGVLAAAVFVPRLGGATPYAVETGSMRPDLPPGSLVVVRPTPAEDIGVGTVVTYQLESGKEDVVTHRVVATAVDGKGQLLFQTRGDANGVPDAEWVAPAQLRGTLWYAAPHIGHLNVFVAAWERQVVTYVGAALLALYAAGTWAAAATRRLRQREADPRDREPVTTRPRDREVARVHAR